MALPVASALLTISHMSLLLSMHRFVWLSQQFLGPTALAVYSEAEPFKQLLCLLDFVLKHIKRACMVHCVSAEGRPGAEFAPRLACHCQNERLA